MYPLTSANHQSLLALSLILLLSLACCVISLSKHPILIVVSFDGFGQNLLSPVHTPHLYNVKKTGVSAAYMNNQFPTSTFPNHQSLATGLFPESHGVIFNKVFDPLYNQTLKGHSGSGEPRFWNFSTSVIPLWTLNEWRGDERYSGVMMFPGCGCPYGANRTLPTYFKEFQDLSENPQYTFERRVDDILGWLTDEKKPANLIFAYFNQPDGSMHNHPEQVNLKVRPEDEVTGYLIKSLKDRNITDKVNIIFLADHGSAQVDLTIDPVIKYRSIVDNEDGSRYQEFGGSPLLQIWPKRTEETVEIYRTFKKAAEVNGNFSVFLREDLKTERPNWHYTNNRRIMPILLLAHIGHVFEDFNKTDLSHPYGVHGYDNAYLEMRPFFMATGPLFKENGSVKQPFDNVDLFPLICRIMDINPPGHNGSLANVLPILKDTGRTSLELDRHKK